MPFRDFSLKLLQTRFIHSYLETRSKARSVISCKSQSFLLFSCNGWHFKCVFGMLHRASVVITLTFNFAISYLLRWKHLVMSFDKCSWTWAALISRHDKSRLEGNSWEISTKFAMLCWHFWVMTRATRKKFISITWYSYRKPSLIFCSTGKNVYLTLVSYISAIKFHCFVKCFLVMMGSLTKLRYFTNSQLFY